MNISILTRRSLVVLSLVIASCVCLAEGLPSNVSLVRLLANPADYDAKTIIVSGYLCKTGPQQYGLFLGRSDCEDFHFGNSVEVDISRVKKQIPRGPQLLTIEGTFRSRAGLIHTDESYQWGVIEANNASGRNLR